MNRKLVRNGGGTLLTLMNGDYISFGKDDKDIIVRHNGIVFAFDTFDEMFDFLHGNGSLYRNVSEKEIKYYGIIIGTKDAENPENEITATIYITGIIKPSFDDAYAFLGKQINTGKGEFILGIEEIEKSKMDEYITDDLELHPVFGAHNPNTFANPAGVFAADYDD